MKKKLIIIIASVVLVGALGTGGYLYWKQQNDLQNASTGGTTSTEAAALNLDNGDEDINWDSMPTKEVTLTNDGLTITEAGTYVLSGSTTGGVTVNADGQNVRLVLNNATISSTTTAGIYVIAADNTVIQTQAGTTNTVSDAATRSDAEIDGAIYSADDLILQGDGTLIVKANHADAIAGKDDLKINSGTYQITSVDDGIRGRDSVVINGGTFTIKATGDGIKSTNDTDAAKGYTYIKGGTFTIESGDDGIKAETKLIIDGGNIKIPSSMEGLEAANITINGGTIDLYATDDGINASADTMGTTVAITINGGDLTVKVGAGDTDAIDANGDITVTGGKITITASSSFDYDGTATMTGGTLIINGQQVSSIPASMMPGGGGMRR